MIFFSRNKKLEARRRFGSRNFQSRIKRQQNYRRVFYSHSGSFYDRVLRRIGLHSRLLRFVIYGLLFLIGYYLVVSPYFLITGVEVAGNQQVSADQIRDGINQAGHSRLFLIPKNHYLLMTPGRVNQLLTASLPMIKQVTKSKRIGHNQIAIEIKERAPGFVLKTSSRTFLVDDEGVVVKETTETKDLPLVLDEAPDEIMVGQSLSNLKTVAFILSMYRAWPSKISSAVAAIKLYGQASSEVQFVSVEGWSVFFGIKRSVFVQLGNLALLLSKVITPQDRAKLAYIDLRLEKWAYYCLRDKPCAASPQQNLGDTTNATP